MYLLYVETKYQVLFYPTEYFIYTQVFLVFALTALYNFIHQYRSFNIDDYLAKRKKQLRIKKKLKNKQSIQSIYESKNNNTSKDIEVSINQIAEQTQKTYQQY